MKKKGKLNLKKKQKMSKSLSKINQLIFAAVVEISKTWKITQLVRDLEKKKEYSFFPFEIYTFPNN